MRGYDIMTTSTQAIDKITDAKIALDKAAVVLQDHIRRLGSMKRFADRLDGAGAYLGCEV